MIKGARMKQVANSLRKWNRLHSLSVFAGWFASLSLTLNVSASLPDANLDDAFVEGTGTQFVNLCHRKTPNTRIWLDFRSTSNDPDSAARYLLGTDGGTDVSWCSLYEDSNGYFYFKHGTAAYPIYERAQNSDGSGCVLDTKRHTMDMAFNADGAGHVRCIFTTECVTNSVRLSTTDTSLDSGVNTNSLALFAQMANYPNGFKGWAPSKARVYGVKIWEGNMLVHDYVPRKVEGKFYLKDLVNGVYITADPRADIDGRLVDELGGGGRMEEDFGDGYLESDGNQWIDLGFKGRPNMKAELDYAFVDTTPSERHLFGCSGENVGDFTFMGYVVNSGLLGYGCASDQTVWSYFPDTAVSRAGIKYSTARRTLVLDAYGDIVAYLTAGFTNSVVTPLPTTHGSGVTPQNCYLFSSARNSDVRPNCAKMRFYGLKIYENGLLTKRFVPCIRNGLAGILDKENDTDFRVNGTSMTNNTFAVVGGNIEMADGENDMYLESDGTQYIDLGYKASATTRVEMDFATRQPYVASDIMMFGARDSGLNFWAGASRHRMGFTCDNNSSNWSGLNESNGKINLGRMKLVFDAKNNRITCTQGGAEVFACNANSDPSKYAGGRSNLDMFLFAVNRTGDALQNSSLRIYSFKIYENDVLVHAFYPHRSGNVIGLRDVQTGAVKTDVANSANPFRIRGYGRDGVPFAFTAMPKSSYSVAHSGSTTISVSAPNTDRFVWRKNGEVIQGETSSTLTVAWERVREPVAYTVAPIYTINPTDGFVDRDVEMASAAFTVTNLPRGFSLSIR